MVDATASPASPGPTRPAVPNGAFVAMLAGGIILFLTAVVSLVALSAMTGQMTQGPPGPFADDFDRTARRASSVIGFWVFMVGLGGGLITVLGAFEARANPAGARRWAITVLVIGILNLLPVGVSFLGGLAATLGGIIALASTPAAAPASGPTTRGP